MKLSTFDLRARAMTSQEVTHPNTAPARARLTSEFLQFPGLHGFKMPHAKLIRGLTYKHRVRSRIFPMRANGDSPFEAYDWYPVVKGAAQTKFSQLEVKYNSKQTM